MKTKRASQCEQILEALRQGRELTPLEALHEFGCFRLGARIWELTQAGHDIESRIVHQNGKHFASYKLIDQRSDLSRVQSRGASLPLSSTEGLQKC